MSVVLDTLFISLGAWMIGSIMGGALGTLIALRARALFDAAPHLRRLSMLMPGRTVVLNLLMVTWMPAGVFLVGLKPVLGLLNTGLDILLFALLITVSILLEQWYPSLFAVRVIAGLRTLATTSLAAAAFLSDFYGIGWYMSTSLTTWHYEEFLQEWLVLATLILILDVLLGIVQLVAADRIGKRQQLHSVI